jgi:NACHT NTPase-like protein
MVLDPISAIGLAGNIVQFLDFARSIISESHAVYHSADGTKDEFAELEAIARHIQGFTSSLKDPNFETKTADAFDAVRKSCLDVATELSGILNSLKVNPGPRQSWRSFQQATKSVWKKDKIHELQLRLYALRNQVTMQMMYVFFFFFK